MENEVVEVRGFTFPKGATGKCNKIISPYPKMHCQINWTPKASDVGEKAVSIGTRVTNPYDKFDYVSRTYKRTIKVKAAPKSPQPPVKSGGHNDL